MDINSKNEEQGSTNEEQSQEVKNENNLVNEESKSEINSIEGELESGNEGSGSDETNPVDAKKSNTIRTIGVVILLLLPLAYIFYKTTSNPKAPQEQPAAANAPVDVSTYENIANSSPTFVNLLNLSNIYINKGMPGKSIEPLKKAISMNPKSAAAYSNLGLAYTMIQQYREGIEACEKAVQIDSAFQLAKNNLKWAKDEQNKLLIAMHQLEQTPENKRDVAFYNTLGLYQLKLENHDKSIEIFNKILVKDPKNSTALNNIGTAYMWKLQYDDAITHFKKAVEFNSNDQLAKNNLNWALEEKKKADSEQKK